MVLSFLQELLDKGRSQSTLRVFVAAIAAFHAPIAGQSVSRDNSVVRFLKGAKRLNPPRPPTVPTWDLPTVLRALKGPPFEPLQSTNLRSLSLKTALLLPLASVKRVGDLQALSISPACLEFGPNDSKVVLKPLPCQVAARLSRRFSRINLRILWRNGRLYSQMAPPILAGSGGFRRHRLVQLCCRPIGSFFSHYTNQ